MQKRSQQTRIIQFIQLTQKILNHSEYSDIIKWDNEGKKIQILDKQLLESEVLPQFFKHGHYTSFLRQLNIYGFTSWKDENGVLTYSHPHFTKQHTTMKQIKKKKYRMDDKIIPDTFEYQFQELRNNILNLKQEQEKIKRNLLESISGQIRIQESIRYLLDKKIKIINLGKLYIEKSTRFIKTLVSSMTPEHQIQYFILFKTLFPEEHLECSLAKKRAQNNESQEYTHQFQFSPVQLGQIFSKEMINPILLNISPLLFNFDDNNHESQ